MNTDERTTTRASGQPIAEQATGEHYEIRVSGQLGSRWAAWFDGLTLSTADDGTTVLSGPIVDQAALHGLLQKLRDLGIPLLSLTRSTPTAPRPTPTSPGAPS